MLRTLVCSFAAASALVGQAPTLDHFVLTALPGSPAAQVVAVDPILGSSTSIGSFPSDNLTPLAMTQDPFDGDLLVALDQGGGFSKIIRLHRFVGTYIEYPMATLAGKVVDLAVVADTLLIAVDSNTGGLFQMPRRGGSVLATYTQANLTAMNPIGQGYQAVALAWTGRPGTASVDSGVGVYDVTTSQFWFGAFSFPNPTGQEITGVMDLPTAIPRQLLTFDDGTMALYTGIGGPGMQPVPLSPPVPAGGTTAMHSRGPYSVEAVVLGNAAHPFLYFVDAWSGASMGLSLALPGDPIDFAYGVERAAHSLMRGQACGPVALSQSVSSPAELGGTLAVDLGASIGLPVLFVAGLDDFSGGLLPALLPGGCALEVAPDVVTLEFVPAAGIVTKTIPVPATTSLFGTVVHTQWAHYAPTGMSVSNTWANWIGS